MRRTMFVATTALVIAMAVQPAWAKIALNGITLNGITLNGVTLNGHWQNGIRYNGLNTNTQPGVVEGVRSLVLPNGDVLSR